MLNLIVTLPARWPHTVVVVVAILWAALAIISAPLFEHVYVSDGSGVMILAAYVGAFILGSLAVWLYYRGSRPPTAAPRRIELEALFWVISAIAVVGIVLKLVDHLLLHQQVVDLSNLSQTKITVTAQAQKGEYEGPSLFSVLTSPLVGFCFFPALILFLCDRWPSLERLCVAGALFAYPSIDGIVFHGGSSAVAYTLLFAWCAWAAYGRRRGRLFRVRPRTIAIMCVVGLAAVWLGGTLFVQRIDTMYGDPGAYLNTQAYRSQSTIVPSQWMVGASSSASTGGPAMIAYWISLYITSGVFNFMFVVEHFNSMHTLGATQGDVFVRGVAVMLYGDANSLRQYTNPLPGLFQTAFSDVYIDFGVVGGALQAFLMGAVAAALHRGRERGTAMGVFLDPVAKMFLLMSPLVSSFTGVGLYYLLAGLGAVVLSWLFTPVGASIPVRSAEPVAGLVARLPARRARSGRLA